MLSSKSVEDGMIDNKTPPNAFNAGLWDASIDRKGIFQSMQVPKTALPIQDPLLYCTWYSYPGPAVCLSMT